MSCYPKIPSLSLCLSPQVAQHSLCSGAQVFFSVFEVASRQLEVEVEAEGWGGLAPIRTEHKSINRNESLKYCLYYILFYYIEYRVS